MLSEAKHPVHSSKTEVGILRCAQEDTPKGSFAAYGNGESG